MITYPVGMKVVICMDSWKGSLDAAEACRQVAEGIRSRAPEAEIHELPLADGGEGTMERLHRLRPGKWVSKRVTGPLPDRRVVDSYLCWPDSGEAVIELARCAGLTLLTEAERNPLLTTTRGAGEWMADACDRGANTLTLAAGGSATVDGGTGMAAALGWRFLDKQGRDLPPGGGALNRLDRVVPTSSPLSASVRVLCDVTNPLLGPKGAAPVFAPQKGASPDQVKQLEEGLSRLVEVVKRDIGIDVSELSGGGAAGGIAAGAAAFLNAELVSGVTEILRLGGFRDSLRDADWVVTGEGKVDGQSLDGKVVSGVLSMARPAGIPVAVIAGSCELSDKQIRQAGLAGCFAANCEGLPLERAMAEAAALAKAAGARFAETGLCATEHS